MSMAMELSDLSYSNTTASLQDIWTLLFRIVGPSECFGLKGFATRWILRVVVLPLVGVAFVMLIYANDQRLGLTENARSNAATHLFFVVFFCYPYAVANSALKASQKDDVRP